MAILFANDASSALQSSITTSDTQIVVATAQADLFPAPSGSDYCVVTVVDASGNMEIMKCTARSGNIMTVQRAQEGTTAFAFAAGAIVDLRLTAATMESFTQVTGERLPAHSHPAPAAAAVAFTPTGGVFSTNVQAAIAEVDVSVAFAISSSTAGLATKLNLSGGALTGGLAVAGALVAGTPDSGHTVFARRVSPTVGGTVDLEHSASSTLAGDRIRSDSSGNSYRVYEAGGDFRGATLPLAGCLAGIGSSLTHTENIGSHFSAIPVGGIGGLGLFLNVAQSVAFGQLYAGTDLRWSDVDRFDSGNGVGGTWQALGQTSAAAARCTLFRRVA